MSFIEEMFDESETLTDEDRAALAAEERGETYEEPEPEPPPEIVERTRELESELAAERERVWRLDERRRAAEEIEAAIATRRQEPPERPTRLGPRPNPELDPWGSDVWDARRATELLQYQVEEEQAERQRQDFANWVNNDAATFRAEHPDYDQATAHAYKFRVEYWKGLGLPEAHSRAIVDQEAAATAMLAREHGKSPSAMFYELAQKVGYQPKRTQQSSGPVRQRQSLPVRGKPQARRTVTAEDIDALPEPELEATIRRNPHTVVRALEKLGW